MFFAASCQFLFPALAANRPRITFYVYTQWIVVVEKVVERCIDQSTERTTTVSKPDSALYHYRTTLKMGGLSQHAWFSVCFNMAQV